MFISKHCNCRSKEIKTLPANLSLDLSLLSVKSRLDVLFLLSTRPHCVCDIEAHTDMSQSLISHHLSDLSDAGFISSQRKGKYTEYFLTKKGEKIIKALKLITH